MSVPSLARPALVLAALLVAGLGLGAASLPDATAAPAARPFMTLVPDSKVGQVGGTRAYIAASYAGGRLRVYVCDGDGRRPATISRWLTRRWDGRSPTTLVGGGIEVRILHLHADGRISGTLRAFSGPHPFTVEPAAGPAGLYDGIDRGGRLRATWIVRADGTVRGAIVPTRPPRKVCRVITVTLADGTIQERVACCDA